LYGWTKKHVAAGTKQISLKQLRTVLGLDSMEDAEGKIIKGASTDLGEPPPEGARPSYRADKQENGLAHYARVIKAI
jgi:hypothetical protein